MLLSRAHLIVNDSINSAHESMVVRSCQRVTQKLRRLLYNLQARKKPITARVTFAKRREVAFAPSFKNRYQRWRRCKFFSLPLCLCFGYVYIHVVYISLCLCLLTLYDSISLLKRYNYRARDMMQRIAAIRVSPFSFSLSFSLLRSPRIRLGLLPVSLGFASKRATIRIHG